MPRKTSASKRRGAKPRKPIAPKRSVKSARATKARTASLKRAAVQAAPPAAPSEDRNWAVRDLDGPVPGPVSVGQRKELIDAAIEAVSVGTRRGVRSTMWKHFSRATIFECMMRIIVGGEPAQAVSRHVCGVDDPETDTELEARAKRLQALLSTLRRTYLELHAEHRRGVEFARAIDESGDDLQSAVRKLNIKLAMRLDGELDPGRFAELSAMEKQVVLRAVGTVTEAMEKKAKAGKDEASTQQTIKRTETEGGGAETKALSPEELGVLFDSLADGESKEQAMKRVREERQKREAAK